MGLFSRTRNFFLIKYCIQLILCSSHSLFFIISVSKGFLYNIFCSGGINKDDPFNPKDNKENGMMAFFRDVIGNWLCKPYAKAIVLICFLGYLSVASWGVTQLKEGLEKKRLSRFDSYSVDFYDVEDKYFREYPFRINVSFTF